MTTPAHIFREYDIRGKADVDLTDNLTTRLGLGLAKMLSADVNGRARIVVGRDCRLSGPRLQKALIDGLTRGGVDVLEIEIGPTPQMYFAVHHLKADGGIMITGSHNPGDDNGFKMMIGRASFFGASIQELRVLVEAADFAETEPGTVTATPVSDAYIDALTADIQLDKSLKLVVDAGNGSAGPLGLRAFAKLGLTPSALFCDLDGTFPNHHPDPTVAKNLIDLTARVASDGAVAGLAWDGDGDRLGVVDKTGEIIWGDRLLALFARELLKTEPGATIIGDVKCSSSLFTDVNARGGRSIMWKTGHSLIKAKMKEEKASICGEMSGHFFFADRYFGYDDGIYAALRVAEILSKQKKTIAELLSDLPSLVSTPEMRVACPDNIKFDVIERVRKHYNGKEKIIELDGVRVEYEDGAWTLARASNTGPVIVLRMEASDEARLREVKTDMEAVVSSARQALEAT